MTLRRILLPILVVLSVHLAATETDSLMRQVKISILTCAPGQELYSLYGHNAIRVQDPVSGSDVVYNYGTFDFDTPNFAVKFMRGRLPYLLSASSFLDFLQEYEYFERSVVEQELQLTAVQKRQILHYLGVNMLPENRAYQYDFFYDNCATRLRDIINTAVSGVTWPETEPTPKTYRQIIKEYQREWPWTDFGIDLIIGAKADVLADVQDRAFIPDYLDKALSVAHQTNATNERLQYNRKTILDYPKRNNSSSWGLSPFFLFSVLALGEIYFYLLLRKGGKKRWLDQYDNFCIGLLVLAGCLMWFMWFATDHQATKENWNLLWASPLWILWFRKDKMTQKSKLWFFSFVGTSCLISLINALPASQFLPQYFHIAVAPLCLLLLLKLARNAPDILQRISD